MKGWARIHREIENWEFYFSEPFTKAQAWIDLVVFANHTHSSFFIRGVLVEVERGEIAWSEKKMSERWAWSRDKVRRYLRLLETRQQIEIRKSTIISKIFIKKYDQFQSDDTPDKTQERPQTDRRKTADDTHTRRLENEENEKNSTTVEGQAPRSKKKSKPKKRAPPKRAELLATEPQTMTDEKTRDISFPRTRLYGDERINWLLDYFEHRMERKLSGKELWNRRYANLLMKKVGAGTARTIIDFVANPESWWHKRVFQMQTLYNAAEQLKAQAEEIVKRDELNQLASKNFT